MSPKIKAHKIFRGNNSIESYKILSYWRKTHKKYLKKTSVNTIVIMKNLLSYYHMLSISGNK